MHTTAPTERDAKETSQTAGHLAVGQAALLVQFDDGGLGIGSELGGGRPEGVGGLQGVATADASAAALASALANAEFSPHRLGGDVCLELLIDIVIRGDDAAAVRTGIGQRGFEGFVNGLGRRRRPMRVLAVLFADLAAGLFGRRRGFAFGERSGLTLGGAFLVLETLFEIGEPLFEFVDFAIALPAPRACRLVHIGNLGNRPRCSCAATYLPGR